MRYQYHRIEDTTIEPAENIGVLSRENEEETFCPPKSLLPYWPYWAGICQLGIGFLCAIFGSVEAFVLPFLITTEASWSFDRFNCFGAALWSGALLVLCGSCAVSASEKKTLLAIRRFYVLTVFGFAVNVLLMILILWSNRELQFAQESENRQYFYISIVAEVCCLLGCMSLTITLFNYFCPVVFGNVQLWQCFIVCCCPCYAKAPPLPFGSIQSFDSDNSNLFPVITTVAVPDDSDSPLLVRHHLDIYNEDSNLVI